MVAELGHGDGLAPRHDGALQLARGEAAADLGDLILETVDEVRYPGLLDLGAAPQRRRLGAPEEWNVDAPLAADQACRVGQGHAQRAGELGDAAAGKIEAQGIVLVHPRAADLGARLDTLGFAAEQPARQGERVDAEVEQRAAGELGGEQATAWIERRREAEAGLDELEVADAALRQPVAHRVVDGKEARPHRLHEETLGRGGRVDHLGELCGVDGDRLLAQHRGPGGEGRDRRRAVHRVRRRDVDRVDGGALDHLAHVAGDVLDAVAGREVGGAQAVAATDGDYSMIAYGGDGGDKARRDAAVPADTPAGGLPTVERSGCHASLPTSDRAAGERGAASTSASLQEPKPRLDLAQRGNGGAAAQLFAGQGGGDGGEAQPSRDCPAAQEPVQAAGVEEVSGAGGVDDARGNGRLVVEPAAGPGHRSAGAESCGDEARPHAAHAPQRRAEVAQLGLALREIARDDHRVAVGEEISATTAGLVDVEHDQGAGGARLARQRNRQLDVGGVHQQGPRVARDGVVDVLAAQAQPGGPVPVDRAFAGDGVDGDEGGLAGDAVANRAVPQVDTRRRQGIALHAAALVVAEGSDIGATQPPTLQRHQGGRHLTAGLAEVVGDALLAIEDRRPLRHEYVVERVVADPDDVKAAHGRCRQRGLQSRGQREGSGAATTMPRTGISTVGWRSLLVRTRTVCVNGPAGASGRICRATAGACGSPASAAFR